MTRTKKIVILGLATAMLATGCSLREVQAWFSIRGATVSEQQARGIADKVNAQSPAGCDANYADFCVPNNQTAVRCAGGPGTGPEIGPTRIVGWDHFGLDPDGDKIACDRPPLTPITPPVVAEPPPPATVPPTTAAPTTIAPTTAPPTTTLPPTTTTTTTTTTTLPPTTTTTTTTPPGPIPGAGTSFMYVGDLTLGAVRKIDTVTLAVVDTYQLGGVLAGNIAISDSRIFYASANTGVKSIGVYDMATRQNNRTYISGILLGTYLRVSPALPDRLFAASGGSPSTMYQYDVSGPTGVQIGQSAPHGSIGGFMGDYEISDDGTRMWTAASTPYEITEVRTSDLVNGGKRYPTGPYPQSVDSVVIGDKEYIAGGGSNGNVFVFDADDPAIVTPTTVSGTTVTNGVAFNRDGSKVFAAVETYNSSKMVTIDRSTGQFTNAPFVGTADVSMGDFGVDPGTGRVFLTANNSIIVYNPDGTYGRVIAPVGPSSIAFSATAPTSTPPRLVPTSLPNEGPPEISSFTASRTSGSAPLTTAFGWTISDPDDTPLRCEVDVDRDGTPEVVVQQCTSASLRAATITTTGSFSARLTVSDGTLNTVRYVSINVSAPSTDPFGITIRQNGTLTSSQAAAFTAAAARWAQVIRTGLPDTAFSVAADDCADGSPAFSGAVDDLTIEAIIRPIDGPEGILGAAGPCIVRTASGLPAYGVMIFDSADVAQLEADDAFTAVVAHEMAHVLGFGASSPWDARLVGAGTADPAFTGSVAAAEWNTLGGTTAAVPVENSGGPGTADGHWRESVFGNELMTGYLNPGANPLSRVTIGALADLGYGVDLAAADSSAPTGSVAAFRSFFRPPMRIATLPLRTRSSV